MPTAIRPIARRLAAALVTVGVAGLTGVQPGCVGYNVYPPMEGERGFTNVNSDPFPPIIISSLQWVTTRYPPHAEGEWRQPAAGQPAPTPFVVNLPQGMNRMLGERIVTQVGPDARPVAPGNEGLPTYHVARVWVSGDEAKVDIVRPVPNVAFTAQGRPVTQGMTLRLRGGMKPWHVTSHRVWSFNSMPVPALNYLQGEGPAPAAAPMDGQDVGEER